jgi:CRP/FNR family transcriptional regulator, anaerobic regulatory protein
VILAREWFKDHTPSMTFERRDIHNSDVPEICRACEARHKGVCGALTPDQLVTLAKQTTRRVHAAGTVLSHEADMVDSHANIMKGVVKLSKVLADGRQQIVGLQFAPDFLGRPLAEENAMTVEAASDVQICGFPKSTLDRLMAENSGLEHRLLAQTLKELDEAREWMVTLGRKTAAEKVASFLYLIASHIDPEADGGASSFTLPLSRSDIADFLGLTTETVSRQMTRLREEGVIEIENRRNITIPDSERLLEEAGN